MTYILAVDDDDVLTNLWDGTKPYDTLENAQDAARKVVDFTNRPLRVYKLVEVAFYPGKLTK